MTPYLAIIKDSFREALASRVLWILLILISLIFAALAPFGWKRELSYEVSPRDIRRSDELIERLGKPKLLSPDPVAGYVRERLSDELRSKIDNDSSSGRQRFERRRDLAEELTELLEERDFYRPDIWKELELSEEGKQLLAKDISTLSDQETSRLNRLALEAAFPRHIPSIENQSVIFTYAVWELGIPPLPESQIDTIIQQMLAGFIDLFVGKLGVFAAIMVTASIIPNTFDAGSIYLLLSKPIARPLLYLAKFIGGCSFVLINSVYLIVGLWFLVGIRLGVWHHQLIWCIPIFLFLFIIYYSVSGLLGLVWRNTVICIVVTVVFWFVCFVAGTVKFSIDTFVHDPNRVNRVIHQDGNLFATTNNGAVARWGDDTNSWIPVSVESDGPPMPFMRSRLFDPIYNAEQNELRLIKGRGEIVTASAERKWAEKSFGRFPQDVNHVLTEKEGTILAIGSSKVFRLSQQLKDQLPAQNIFGLVDIPALGNEPNFSVIKMEDEFFRRDMVLAANGKHDAIVRLHNGELTTFERIEETYEEKSKASISEDENAILASEGEFIVVVNSSGVIKIVDYGDLTVKNEFTPFGNDPPRFARMSSDGNHIAVVFHDRQVWLYDIKNDKDMSSSLLGQEDLSAVEFDDDNRLLVVDRINRVRTYNLETGEVLGVQSPSQSVIEKVSRYGIDPIYFVFPKPSRLDATINYILTGKETTPIGQDGEDLNNMQIKLDPWGPVWSSLGFTVVMLLISCIYIYRQDY